MIRRGVQAITMTLVAVCVVAGYLGLRALVWRQDYQVGAMVESGIIISALVGAALGIAYVVLGSLLWRLLAVDWLSLQVGALLGALIYGGYNAATPISPFSIGEAPIWRGLQGGIDGLLIGLIIGGLVTVVSGRPLRLDRAGLMRYLLLYLTVILLAWLVLLMESAVHFPDAVGLIVAAPLVIVLRLAVAWLDRRVDSRLYG